MTSQIFANIYLNELDQFVLHSIKPLGYVRYGDDFVLWCRDELAAKQAQIITTQFLIDELHLAVNPKHDCSQSTRYKLAYLGVDIWPGSRRLQQRVLNRTTTNLALENASSYNSLLRHHQPKRYHRRFLWNLVDSIDQV